MSSDDLRVLHSRIADNEAYMELHSAEIDRGNGDEDSHEIGVAPGD